jgi:ankyrin repeat protein
MSALTIWLARQGFPGPLARHSNGDTPLMRAARQGEEGIVRALLAGGGALHAVNDDGNTALWFACLSGNADLITLLIESGSAIDHINDAGQTCLMQVCSRGRSATVQLLLAHGASASLYAPDGRNALDMRRRARRSVA